MKFKVTRCIEKYYVATIEADDEEDAKQIIKSFRLREIGLNEEFESSPFAERLEEGDYWFSQKSLNTKRGLT